MPFQPGKSWEEAWLIERLLKFVRRPFRAAEIRRKVTVGKGRPTNHIVNARRVQMLGGLETITTTTEREGT